MNISVEVAKQIREQIGASHLILFVRAADGSENISTHGDTEQQAHEAADFGNKLKKLLRWPEELCQSTPQQRAEWQRKTVTEIKADIARLLAQKARNKTGREALLQTIREQPARREELEREYASMKRRAEDYDVRIQALEWVLVVTPLDRAKLSTAATYAQLVDSLTQYGGTNNATTHNFEVPADGIFRVSREHYDPEATPDENHLYSGDGGDQTNNVHVDVAFTVDWQRLKLVLADAEYDLEPAEPRWTDTETWVVIGDGFEEALCLCRFTEKHYPKEEVGVCFLAEWE
jgi:hypothetical protein